MRKLFMYVVLSWMLPFVNAKCTLCSRGEKCHTSREGDNLCVMCDSGKNYMPFVNHTYRQCIPCTQRVNPDLEVVVVECNRFHDTVILCIKGYFRYRDVTGMDVCKKCTHCEFPKRECQIYNDAVCCDPREEANTTEAGLDLCKKKSILCEEGQFFWTTSGKCDPCPPGTNMPYSNHTFKDCLQCEGLSINSGVNHAIIIRPCNRTAPALFGCEKGYFRDPRHESLETEVPCTPCRNCSRSLRDCGMFRDAVCDDEDLTAPTSPVTSTWSTGSSEEEEKGARGKSSDNQDRKKVINGETQIQKSISCKAITYVTIFTIIVISIILLYIFFCMKSHSDNNELDHRNIAGCGSRKFRTIILGTVCILIVVLLMCICFHAGIIPVPDEFIAVFVGGTIAVGGFIFIIAILNLSWREDRQPNKSHDKEKYTTDMKLHERDELVKMRNDALREVNEVNENEDVMVNK